MIPSPRTTFIFASIAPTCINCLVGSIRESLRTRIALAGLGMRMVSVHRPHRSVLIHWRSRLVHLDLFLVVLHRLLVGGRIHRQWSRCVLVRLLVFVPLSIIHCEYWRCRDTKKHSLSLLLICTRSLAFYHISLQTIPIVKHARLNITSSVTNVLSDKTFERNPRLNKMGL